MIRVESGFTVGVWDIEQKVRANVAGSTKLQVTVTRPDESVVERAARTTKDPNRVEILWHDQDMSLPGIYVGTLSGMTAEGDEFCLEGAFKLSVGGELG